MSGDWIGDTVSLTSGGPVVAAPWRRGAAASGATSVHAGAAASVFVSHTVFRHDRWRDLPAIAYDAGRAARLWARQPGALWLRQWTQLGARRLGDLSVWRSEDDLHQFLALPEHLELMRTWDGRMRGVHHAWNADTIDRSATWSEALSRLRE